MTVSTTAVEALTGAPDVGVWLTIVPIVGSLVGVPPLPPVPAGATWQDCVMLEALKPLATNAAFPSVNVIPSTLGASINSPLLVYTVTVEPLVTCDPLEGLTLAT